MISESYNKLNLLLAIQNYFSKISCRELDIALQRWGMGRCTSYSKIGLKYNITKERIRQILEQIKRNFQWEFESNFDEWRKRILDELIIKPESITVNSFKHFNLIHSAYLYLGFLSEIFDEIPFKDFFPKSFESYLGRKVNTEPKWNKVFAILEELELPFKEITPQKLIMILSDSNCDLYEQLLCFKIILGSKKYFFMYENQKYFLLRKGNIKDITYSILSSSQDPMQINDILGIVHLYYNDGTKYESSISVISNIKQDERIIQFDRYIFGVNKHYSYPRKKWYELCSKAKIFLSTNKRQCYIAEIFNHLISDFPNLRSKYELVNILRSDPQILDLGFFSFSVLEVGIKSRIKLKDII